MIESYAVIIPTRQRPASLARAVQSVIAQTIPPGEIFVVDNSPPASGLKATDVSALGSCVTIISAPDAPNAAAVRNRALQRVSCRYVAFLDDDDEWLRDKMELQLAWLADHPDHVAVVCGRRVVSPEGERIETPAQDTISRLLDYDNFGGSFSFITFDRTRCPDLVLDERLSAFQDWDFLLRARRFGGLGIVPRELAIYHDHRGPRVTSQLTGRRRSLQIVLATHHRSMPHNARRWVYSRILALRYCERKALGHSGQNLRLLCRSISIGSRTKFPLPLRFRALLGRAFLAAPRSISIFTQHIASSLKVRASRSKG